MSRFWKSFIEDKLLTNSSQLSSKFEHKRLRKNRAHCHRNDLLDATFVCAVTEEVGRQNPHFGTGYCMLHATETLKINQGSCVRKCHISTITMYYSGSGFGCRTQYFFIRDCRQAVRKRWPPYALRQAAGGHHFYWFTPHLCSEFQVRPIQPITLGEEFRRQQGRIRQANGWLRLRLALVSPQPTSYASCEHQKQTWNGSRR